TYGKYTLHNWTDDKQGKPQVGVFASDNTIVISQSRSIVEHTLDVLDDKADNISSTDKLTQLDSTPKGTIIVAAAQEIGTLAGDNPQAAMFKHTNMMALVVAEKTGDLKISLNLQAKDTETATQLQQMAQGIMAMASLKANGIDGAAELLKAIKITSEDTNVAFNFSYPSRQLFELIKKHSDNVKINIDIDNSTEEESK
ncbi:MAG: hypothetical protein KAS23_08980, partial [Anaerohalosphaera sp.]|nr:hypothetical protein [Anaerohalosphaera sp.]